MACSVGLALTLQIAFVGLRLEFKTDLSMVLFACFLVNKALSRTMVQIPLTLIHVVIGGSECREGQRMDGAQAGNVESQLANSQFLLDCVLSLRFWDIDTLMAYLKVPLVFPNHPLNQLLFPVFIQAIGVYSPSKKLKKERVIEIRENKQSRDGAAQGSCKQAGLMAVF